MDLKTRGCLPVDCLEMPLIELLQRRQRKDEERGHHSNARRCQTVTWRWNFMGFNMIQPNLSGPSGGDLAGRMGTLNPLGPCEAVIFMVMR